MKNADYRKYNDRTQNSSTYHKKDGTSMRHILKEDTQREIKTELTWEERAVEDYYYEKNDDSLDDYDDDYDYDYNEDDNPHYKW